MSARCRRKAVRAAFRLGLKSAGRWWGWCLHDAAAAKLFADVHPKHRRNPWAAGRYALREGVKPPLHIAQANAFDAGWEAFKP